MNGFPVTVGSRYFSIDREGTNRAAVIYVPSVKYLSAEEPSRLLSLSLGRGGRATRSLLTGPRAPSRKHLVGRRRKRAGRSRSWGRDGSAHRA